MQKKIGDLTLREVVEIRKRCANYENCKECKQKDRLCSIACCIAMFIEGILDQEVEVEE